MMRRRSLVSMPGSFAVAIAIAAWVLIWTQGVVYPHEATNVQGQPLGIPYPISCCSLQDCRPTIDGEVKETPQGYTLVSTGEFVPHGDRRIKPFPADGKIHVCQQAGNFDSGRILCLLVPPPSF
jgi:hypothetical protein